MLLPQPGALLDSEGVATIALLRSWHGRGPCRALISYYAKRPPAGVVMGAGVIYGVSLLAAGRTRLKPKGL